MTLRVLPVLLLSLLLPLAAGLAQVDHADGFEGDALVQISTDGWLRLALDTRDTTVPRHAGQLDQWVDRVFFAHVPELNPSGLEGQWRDAVVLWSPQRLVLRTRGGDRELHLRISEPSQAGETAQSEISSREDRGQIALSLAHYRASSWGVTLADLEAAPFPDTAKVFQDFPDLGGGTSSANCDAGGISSTSCTVTRGDQSCSITCTAPNYACCIFEPMKCKCNS